MLKYERHQLILKKLKKDRKVLSVDLSEELGVSEDTIRRDLKELDIKKLLYKVHGGALSSDTRLLTYNERIVSNLEKKKIIAKKAVELIHDNQVIIMSGSTINIELARIIPNNIKATVFTYSLPIAIELSKHPLVEIIFIGGKLNKSALVTVGIDVVNTISNIRADISFIGTAGINSAQGVTEPDWEVAHIKKSIVEISDYSVVTCVSPKILNVKKFLVVPIKEIDMLITDIEPEDTVFNDFKEEGLTIV